MSGLETAAKSCMDDAAIKEILLNACKNPPERRPLRQALDGMAFKKEGDILFINFAYPFFEQYYKNQLKGIFEKILRRVLGADLRIIYGSTPQIVKSEGGRQIEEVKDDFAEIVYSDKSRPAILAAKRLCDLSEAPFLLVICGQSGSGKTTLLNAMRRAFNRALGSDIAYMASADNFQAGWAPEIFWQKYKALLLDDCHNKSKMDIAAYLEQPARQIGGARAAIAFTGKSQDIDKLEKRLATRAKAGLVLEMHPADLSMRIAYIEKFCQNITFTRQEILALARMAPDIPALMGLLQKMKFYGKITGQPLSTEALAKITSPGNQTAGWQKIVAKVAEKTQLKQADILGPSRKHDFVMARMAAMYLCRIRLGLSYPEIGRLFGGRDHASVIYAIKKILELRKVDNVMNILLTELEGDDR